MPGKDDIYNIWAPPESVWSRWVKPVLFAFMDAVLETAPARSAGFENDWVHAPGSAAMIVDLPGDEGVLWGMHLARLGYRPIPLYNALPFPLKEMTSRPVERSLSTVNVEPILTALHRETAALQELRLPAGAPPAFLLDSDRRFARIKPLPGVFDNRSVCFPTDFPSAEFLLAQGIGMVIIVQEHDNVAGDLLQVLLAWQAAGIQLFRKKWRDTGSASARPVTVERPSFLRRLWYLVTVRVGLRTGELGAFGGIVPHAG